MFLYISKNKIKNKKKSRVTERDIVMNNFPPVSFIIVLFLIMIWLPVPSHPLLKTNLPSG